MTTDRFRKYSRVCLPLCLFTATAYSQMDKGGQEIVRLSDNPEPRELAAAKDALKNGDIVLSTGTDVAKFDSLLDIGLGVNAVLESCLFSKGPLTRAVHRRHRVRWGDARVPVCTSETCWCKAKTSLSTQSRNVSVITSSSSCGVECGNRRSVAVSKVCGKGGTASSFHAFHQTVISTAARERFFST